MAAITELLPLAFGLIENLAQASEATAGITVFAPNDSGFPEHVASDALIGGLAVGVVAIVHEKLRHVPDPAFFAAEAELEFVVGGILEFFLPVSAQPGLNRPAHKKRLVADVIQTIEQNPVVIAGLGPAIDFVAMIIHVNDVAKQRLPFWVLGKSLRNLTQRPRPEGVVGIEDDEEFPLGAGDALVHRIVVAFILFRDPFQVRTFRQDFTGVVLGAAINHNMFPVREILLHHTDDGVADGRQAVKTRRDDGDGGCRLQVNRCSGSSIAMTGAAATSHFCKRCSSTLAQTFGTTTTLPLQPPGATPAKKH